jgi:hypothetical protein
MSKREITRADIMDLADYTPGRKERRRDMMQMKANRRIAVGPFATFYFENYATMWHQVHEMLAIEKGGEAQIPDELEAYNPLIPQGRELIATVMIEIDDPIRRKTVLNRMGGFEEHMYLELDGERISSRAEVDVDRTSAKGKASSVQFVHFELTDAQAEKMEQANTRAILGIDHENYAHMAVIPESARAELAGDLD